MPASPSMMLSESMTEAACEQAVGAAETLVGAEFQTCIAGV